MGKAGEKIIIILDMLDHLDKASMIGKLFRACMQGKFDFNAFLRLSHIINNAFIDDIKSLRNCFTSGRATYKLDDELADSLNRIGLTSTTLEADPYTQERFKRINGRNAASIPYKYKVVHALNKDAFYISPRDF